MNEKHLRENFSENFKVLLFFFVCVFNSGGYRWNNYLSGFYYVRGKHWIIIEKNKWKIIFGKNELKGKSY